jgi:type IV secretory pathway protease TraF
MTFERMLLIIISVLLLSFVTRRYDGITANVTDSRPSGLDIQVGGLPHRGSLVQLRPLMKYLAGVPGDVIQITPQGNYINGKLWPNSRIPKQTHGYKPYPFGTIRLQPNRFWMLGSADNSWDCRFLGPLTGELIAATITPLWTTERGHQ